MQSRLSPYFPSPISCTPPWGTNVIRITRSKGPSSTLREQAQVTPRSRGGFFPTGIGLPSLQFQTRLCFGRFILDFPERFGI